MAKISDEVSFYEKPIPHYRADRRCKLETCKKKLCRYNPWKYCFVHHFIKIAKEENSREIIQKERNRRDYLKAYRKKQKLKRNKASA